MVFETRRVGSNMHGLKCGSRRIWLRTDLPPGSNMHELKSGSCRFWQRTDLPPDSNMHGLKSGSCRFWQRTDLPPGSNMHGLKSGSYRFWLRTDLPPGSNMLRRAAQTCSACKLAGVQIIPLPTLANQILARTFFRSFRCPRWRIKFSLERFSDP